MRKNCATEGREFAIILRSVEQFIRTVKGQTNVWEQNAFSICSWRFLKSNKLEQVEFKLEKNYWLFSDMQEKLEKKIVHDKNVAEKGEQHDTFIFIY